MTELALVTGGSGYIGSAISEKLTSDGFDVVVVDRQAPAHAFARDFVEVDLSRGEETRAVLAGYCKGRPVTRLVNNAGIVRRRSFEEATTDDFDAVMHVNVQAALVASQVVVPEMRREGIGRIVNISSRAALGKEMRTVYSASKAALIGLTRTMALELAADHITVNAVGPGPIRTPLFESTNPPDSPQTQAILAAIPVGHIGEPSDIAAAVSFLASNAARFVTGQTLYVCGGMTIGAVR